MTILVLDGDLLDDALAQLADDELLIVVDSSADRLEELQRRYPDPRITYLIGDGEVIPVPDASVDRALGDGSESELRRVLRVDEARSRAGACALGAGRGRAARAQRRRGRPRRPDARERRRRVAARGRRRARQEPRRAARQRRSCARRGSRSGARSSSATACCRTRSWESRGRTGRRPRSSGSGRCSAPRGGRSPWRETSGAP